MLGIVDLPNGENTPSLGKASFLLDASNSLFEDGGDFGWRGFGIGSIASDLFTSGVNRGLQSCTVLSIGLC